MSTKNIILSIALAIVLLIAVSLVTDKLQVQKPVKEGFLVGYVSGIGENDLTLKVANYDYLVTITPNTEIINGKNIFGKLVEEPGQFSDIRNRASLVVYYLNNRARINSTNKSLVEATKIVIKP